MVSFTPRPLYPQGKGPRYPLDRRLGGPQSRSGHGDEEKNSQPPPQESNPRTPIVQSVAQQHIFEDYSGMKCSDFRKKNQPAPKRELSLAEL
jgi:hypothetical protein